MKKNITSRYHELINKNDRTKEENRELETLKKVAHINGLITAMNNAVATDKDNINLVDYTDTCNGLYRVQVKINGKLKTVARLKFSKKDVYILVRETTARVINKEYEIINYNLPAGFHIDNTNDLFNTLIAITNYHITEQTA